MDLITRENLKEVRKHLTVELANPDVVRDYYRSVGDFARVCYDSETEAEKIGAHCIEAGHWPPARACYFIFKVRNMARILTQQVCRHHVGVEFAQRSQRYCDESAPALYIPDSIMSVPEALDEFIACQNVVYRTYRKLGELGIPMDDARLVLTNATASDFNIALTPQALSHFCGERLCTRASDQTRMLAQLMRHEVMNVEYRFKSLLGPKCSNLGYCPEKKSCGRMPSRKEVGEAYLEHTVRKMAKQNMEMSAEKVSQKAASAVIAACDC